MKRKIIPLLLLFVSSQVNAFECAGFSIKYIPATSIQLNGHVAMADIDKQGNRLVYYDQFIMPQLPKVLQDHIWAHECAHHKSNDVVKRKTYNADKEEFAADCEAVRMLGWSDTEVNELVEEWRKLMPDQKIFKSRSENIKTCLTKN